MVPQKQPGHGVAFARILRHASRVIDPIVRWIFNVGVFLLALMMFLTAADVILRYFFNRPILGSYEISEFMMAALAAVTIGYAARIDAHVNVDLIYARLPQGLQHLLSLFTNLVCVVFFGLMSWRNFYQSRVLQNAHSVSASLSIPEFPFVLVLGVGFGITALVFFLKFLESLAKALNQWTP
jgi:TRAP-type C4-dicarboxylate transport system permease small subunit